MFVYTLTDDSLFIHSLEVRLGYAQNIKIVAGK
jgi:hypothetical protein